MMASMSPSSSSTSAAIRAGSLPRDTTPTPTEAARMAAASFAPSPTIAVTSPRCCFDGDSSACTTCTLCSGAIRANTRWERPASTRSVALSRSHSVPVITSSCSTAMPRSRAMTAAVTG